MTDEGVLSPRLPPELTDHIISFLDCDVDKNTLSCCSLVCKGWLPAARYQRFNTLRTDTYKSTATKELLDNSPSIATYVTKLSFNSIGTLFTYGTLTSPLPDIYQALPNLIEIEFTKLDLVPESDPQLQLYFEGEEVIDWTLEIEVPPVAVERLRFSSCLLSPDAMTRFFTPFLTPKELCFDRCLLEGIQMPVKPIQQKLWSVFQPPKCLKIERGLRSVDAGLLCRLFTWDREDYQLPVFIVEITEPTHVLPMVSFLERLGPTINHFELTVDSDASIPRESRWPPY